MTDDLRWTKQATISLWSLREVRVRYAPSQGTLGGRGFSREHAAGWEMCVFNDIGSARLRIQGGNTTLIQCPAGPPLLAGLVWEGHSPEDV